MYVPRFQSELGGLVFKNHEGGMKKVDSFTEFSLTSQKIFSIWGQGISSGIIGILCFKLILKERKVEILWH